MTDIPPEGPPEDDATDGPALYARLNAERLRRQRQIRRGGFVRFPYYTWVRVARESRVPPSSIAEYKYGRQPRAENLARLLAWLNAEVSPHAD